MYFYLIALASITIDIISKKIAIYKLVGKINLLGEYLSLKLIYNTGIAFSMPISGLILKILTFIIIVGIVIYYLRIESIKHNRIIDTGYGLIIGGAIGNGIERIFIGKVTDFIALKYFAIFNFGDIFINVGAIIILIYYYKIGLKNKKLQQKI